MGGSGQAWMGWVRASLDADALVSLKHAAIDLDQLADRFRAMGWKAEVRMGEPGDPLGFVVRIQDLNGNQADLIGGIRNLDPGFFTRVLREDWDGIPLKFASAEDLLALKFFAGGPKDLEDAEGILRVRSGSIDKVQVSRLSRALGRDASAACENIIRKSA